MLSLVEGVGFAVSRTPIISTAVTASTRKAAGRFDGAALAGRPARAGDDRLAQAEPGRPDAEGDRPRAALDRRSRRCDCEGTVSRISRVGAGFPDSPWLFRTDGEYKSHASVTLGQFESTKNHMRSLRDVSEILNDRSGVVIHEVVADGSI